MLAAESGVHRCGWTISVALGCALVCCAPAPSQAAELFRGRCHMDQCTWFSVEGKDLVASDPRGALFKVTMKWWESHHPNGSYEKRAPRKGGEATVDYVFCSKSKPAVLYRSQGEKWTGTILSISAPSGASETATAHYLAVCHGAAVKDERDLTRSASKFGYTRQDEDSFELGRPEDILKR